MKTVCKENACTGCMACVGKCKKNAIKIKDSLSAYNAVIDDSKCINCGACEEVCPNNNEVSLSKPLKWNEGWALEDVREKSSSGGIASAIMRFFVEDGGYVAACIFKGGEFIFDITNKKDELINYAGSKYVKSNPLGIYDKIVEKLKGGNKVLLIGLPCQIAALKNYTKKLAHEEIDRLYTVDLICHGSPSPQILELALHEKGIDIKALNNIRFRNKTNFYLELQDKELKYKTIAPVGVQDMYTHAFLKSIDYTENCYSCRYATFERVSDITIGDSWGSNLPDSEQRKGVSLILCQTNKGIDLLSKSNIQLKEVDIEKSVQANHQLRHPSIMQDSRKVFFSSIDKGFYKAISKSSPKEYYKQKLKEILIKLKIIRRG